MLDPYFILFFSSTVVAGWYCFSLRRTQNGGFLCSSYHLGRECCRRSATYPDVAFRCSINNWTMGGTFCFGERPNVVSISNSWELLRSSRNTEDDHSANSSVCIKPTFVTRFSNNEISTVATSLFPTSIRECWIKQNYPSLLLMVTF